MKIKSIHIQNFRSFEDETIHLNRYSCFVGPNGAGKSSVLAALNVFFREQSGAATDITKLTDEDYFGKNTANPVRITVTFDDLNQTAQTELSAYVRQNELVVTAEAVFDANTTVGVVRHFGQRVGMAEFRRFFYADTSRRVGSCSSLPFWIQFEDSRRITQETAPLLSHFHHSQRKEEQRNPRAQGRVKSNSEMA